jgi:dienelactone hydrolase
MGAAGYDPFAEGPFPVGVRTIYASDAGRGRLFPCEIWYPAQAPGRGELRNAAAHAGTYPLVVFSHYSGGHRRTATFLCAHLAGHGYVVAALDHSEVVAKELSRREGETSAEQAARINAVIGSRVPDVRFLIDHLVADESGLDLGRVGLVGHSFGGWTALATSAVDTRVRAVVAMAPGGSSNPKPGILPLKLTFNWGRDVPTLYLAADLDVSIPPAGVYELFDRTPSSKRMFVLQRADHQHFLDDVEGAHEAVRAAAFPAEAAWIPAAMRPIAELSSGEQAHVFVRGLTLAHLDAILRQLDAAERFLAGDVEAELSARGVEAFAHPPSRHRMRTFKE